MLADSREGIGTTKLPGDLAPGRQPRGLTFATPTFDDIKLGTNEDSDCRTRDIVDMRPVQDVIDAPPAPGLLSAFSQMVERGQRMGLAPTELRRHVEHCRCLELLTRESPDNLG